MLVSLVTLGQSNMRELKDSIIRRFVVSSTTFADGGLPSIGGGIIIAGNYYATCWHVIYQGNRRPVKTVVTFTRYSEQNTWVYDSTEVDYNYKAKLGQYDFSKHRYDTLVRSDFVVLKLKKPAPSVGYRVYRKHLAQKEFVYTRAPIETAPHVFEAKNTRCLATNDAYDFDQNKTAPPPCMVMYGAITQGSSGSPMYDSTGQVMGIVSKAALNFNTLTEPFRKDPEVIEAYKNGQVQMLILRMDYIVDKYLKGYLK